MINGLLTLRGAWHKVAQDPILKFFVVAVTAYGMSTFEGPMLSIKSVNALAALHRLDHRARAHGRARLERLHDVRHDLLAAAAAVPDGDLQQEARWKLHFWIASVGIVLYVVAIYSAGVTQGLMWRAFDETGRLAYPDFVETVLKLMPMYWMRVIGGLMYLDRHGDLRLEHRDDVASSPGGVRGAGHRGGAAGEGVRAGPVDGPAGRAGELHRRAVAPQAGSAPRCSSPC